MKDIFNLFLYYPQRFLHLQIMCLNLFFSKKWSLKCYSITKFKYLTFEMNIYIYILKEIYE
jgi:hypothetical protein